MDSNRRQNPVSHRRYRRDLRIRRDAVGKRPNARASPINASTCVAGFRFGECFFSPLVNRLMLDRGESRPTDESIVVGQDTAKRLSMAFGSCFAVKRFQLMTSLASWICRRCSLRRVRSIRHPHRSRGKARLHQATSDGEVHRTVVGVDDRIGNRQRCTGDELFFCGGVRCTILFQMDGVKPSPTPIECK